MSLTYYVSTSFHVSRCTVIFRVTYGFSGMGTGWAETHAVRNDATNPRDLLPILADVCSKRVQMLGREFSLVGLRISRYANDAGVRQKGAFLDKQVYTNAVTTASAAAEPAKVALLIRGYALASISNPAFDANSNLTYLGAPLDISVDNAGIVYPGKGGLGAAFAQWRSVMRQTRHGWLANETIFNQPLNVITQLDNGTVQMVFEAPLVNPLVIGQRYKARIREVNNGVSALNGDVIVTYTALNTLRTKEIIGIPTAQAGGAIRLYKQVQPFVEYGELVLSETVSNHKRGRPFGSTPGRARRRIRG